MVVAVSVPLRAPRGKARRKLSTAVIRLWLIKAMPFLGKWLEVAPACCGTCPTCAGTAVSGLTLELFGATRTSDPTERS